MGYTHYFRNNTDFKFTPEEFTQLGGIVRAIIRTAATKTWSIKVQKEDTTITDLEIKFNGLRKGDLGHEDFYITCFPDKFNFCKTAYKPYDAIVTATLLAVAIISKGQLNISSDGSQTDWLYGFKLLTTAMPQLTTASNLNNLILSDERLTFGFSELELDAVKYQLTTMYKPAQEPIDRAPSFLDGIPPRILFIGGYSSAGKSSALKLLEAKGIPCFSTSRILHELVDTISTVRMLEWDKESTDRDRCIKLAETVLIPTLGRELFVEAVMRQVKQTNARIIAIETIGGLEYTLFKSLTKAHRCTAINIRRDSEKPRIDLRKLLPKAIEVSNNRMLCDLDDALELVLAGIREPR